jgi:hypothetical protein
MCVVTEVVLKPSQSRFVSSEDENVRLDYTALDWCS